MSVASFWRSLEALVASCAVTVDLEKRACEVKRLRGCTPGEVARVLLIHNAGSQSAILLPRDTSYPLKKE